MLKEEFGMTDKDFKKPKLEGNEPVAISQKIKLTKKKIDQIIEIVGKNNVETDDYSRVRFSHGKTVDEAGVTETSSARFDIVVHPEARRMSKIVGFCNQIKSRSMYGGGSSVTFGLRPQRRRDLVMTPMISCSPSVINQTAVVRPGMMGPA
jgi:alkyldihydroxyacetonephosphate synthase